METLRDPVSSASHFLMSAVAVVIALFLLRITRGGFSRRLSVLIFGCAAILLYASSGLYHALRLPADELRFFQLLDMSAIYIMIAACSTPLAIMLLRGRTRAIFLWGEWGIAIIGIISLWVLPKPDHSILVASYMAMAWFSFPFLVHFWRATGWKGTRWLLATMMVNATGAAMDLLHWPVIWSGVIQWHELLHFCDMLGTAFFLVFLVKYVLPYQSPEPDTATEPEPYGATAQESWTDYRRDNATEPEPFAATAQA